MYKCSECFNTSTKWQGKCNQCQSWNSFVQETQEPEKKKSSKPFKGLFTVKEISSDKKSRYLSNLTEVNSVLGGGFVPGAVLMLTGDPGVGKSTLALQLAHEIALQDLKVVYCSTEESLSQLQRKISNQKIEHTKILFTEENFLENIVFIIKNDKPDLIVIDSIQNCCSSVDKQNFYGIAGLKETVHEIVSIAKETNTIVLMTGHITKDGSLAGPKLLEHLIDGVFYLQDDKEFQRKILTSVKNRFGPIDEIGFLKMEESGFSDLKDINLEILSQNSNTTTLGTSMFLSFQGSRSILQEIQVLGVKNRSGVPQRITFGIDTKRFLIMAAVLEKYLKLDLSNYDIFCKVRGGAKIVDNTADLAVCIAILSSCVKKPIINNVIALGEIHLNGKITSPSDHERVLKSGQRLGVKNFIIGKNDKNIYKDESLEVKTMSNIYEISEIFDLKL